MFAAPIKDVREAVKRGTLGSLNPMPWAVMTGNCTGWVTYSYIIQNQFVFWANAPGLIISVWLNLCAVKLQYCDFTAVDMRASFARLLDTNRRSFRIPDGEKGSLGGDLEENRDDEEAAPVEEGGAPEQGWKEKAKSLVQLKRLSSQIGSRKKLPPNPHEKLVLMVVTFWISTISLLAFLQLDVDQWQHVIGFVVNINLAFFYGAPLSTIFNVLKARDSSSIHRWTMLMNTANAVFWTAFGFGTTDWYIIVPNGAGVILGVIQLILQSAYPNRDVSAMSDDSAGQGESTGAVTTEVGNAESTATASIIESTVVAPTPAN